MDVKANRSEQGLDCTFTYRGFINKNEKLQNLENGKIHIFLNYPSENPLMPVVPTLCWVMVGLNYFICHLIS